MKVEVPPYAIQDKVTVDPARTALLVIDMQNDFVERGGAMLMPDAAATIPVIARLLGGARAARMHVVYIQDTHHLGDREWQLWPEHCREGTWGWEIVDALRPEPDDVVVRKGRYDAFYDTNLDDVLRGFGADTLIICGAGANICVHYTAASAALRWYGIVVPRDAISAFEPFDLEAALRQVTFALAGEVTTADSIHVVP
jgi:nicotinamidase-related amidase